MSNIHLILQGKGGVGKSYVAYVLAQYFQSCDCKTLFIDTDPVNPTFSSVQSLGVEFFDITDSDDIDQRTFDKLFERILDADENSEIVVDNGSSGYVSMLSYLVQNDTISQLKELGHEVYVHTLIVGGRDLRETMSNFDAMAKQLPSAKYVIWLNHQVSGLVEHKGVSIKESKSFSKYNGQVKAIIDLPKRKESLFLADVRALLEAHQTFAEGMKNTDFPMFSRSRLKRIQTETFASLDESGIFEPKEQKENI